MFPLTSASPNAACVTQPPPDYRNKSGEMDTLLDKLFAVPMSWLLAIPIVLFDRLLATEPPISPD